MRDAALLGQDDAEGFRRGRGGILLDELFNMGEDSPLAGIMEIVLPQEGEDLSCVVGVEQKVSEDDQFNFVGHGEAIIARNERKSIMSKRLNS